MASITSIGSGSYECTAALPKSDPIPIPGAHQRRIPMIPVQRAIEKETKDDTGIEDFFKEQRKIGQQKPKKEYCARYCQEVYEKADEQCYSHISSLDWRLREISIRATEGIIILLQELFDVSFSLIPLADQNGSPSSKAPPEEKKLSDNPAISHDLFEKIKSFHHEDPHENPGRVFLKDLVRRIRNVFENWMSAQLESLKKKLEPSMRGTQGRNEALEAREIQSQKEELEPLRETHLRTTLYEPLACEAARRLFDSGMDPELPDSLLEPHLLKTGSPGTRDTIIDGKRETLSW